jgi:tripartite-type tricarboxylate transporter receptor subunit TctC
MNASTTVPLRLSITPIAPAGTWHPHSTAEIVHKLNKETNACLGDPQLVARFADLGSVPMPLTPAEFGKFIADETEKWSKVIKSANLKLE